jgi:putative spermidine/putrescine transport system substrate-binding protein
MVSVTRSAAIAAFSACLFMAPSARSEELVVGSFGGSFADNVKACHVAAFEKATGATVSLKLGNSSQFAAAIRAAGGNSDMDVVFIDNSLAVQIYNEKLNETLGRAKLTHADEIIPSAWGVDNSYVVAMVSATTLVYNPKVVKTPPTSWLDLFDPQYAGKYAIGDFSGTSGWQFLLALNKIKGGTPENIDPGIEAIKPLAKGSAVLYTQADQIVSLFERGEIAIAVWYPDRAGVAADKGLPIAVAYPKEGAVGILPAIVIPKGTKKLDLAHKFVDVILSAEGQMCFSERAYIGSVNKNVVLPEKVAKIAPTGEALDKLWFIDPEILAKNMTAWTRRWQREVTR